MNEAFFHALFWILLAGMMVIRAFSSLQLRRAGAGVLPDAQAVQHEGRAAFIARVLAFFALIGMLVAYAVDPPWMRQLELPLPPLVRLAAFALGLAFQALWLWAQTLLGRQWSAQVELRQSHHLIRVGPYGWVRHPLYAALGGVSIALGLVTANWLFIGFAVLVLAFIPVRILREEKMLRSGLPDYATYAASVRYRLVPGIW